MNVVLKVILVCNIFSKMFKHDILGHDIRFEDIRISILSILFKQIKHRDQNVLMIIGATKWTSYTMRFVPAIICKISVIFSSRYCHQILKQLGWNGLIMF